MNNDGFDSVPDEQHIETMMDGLMDSLSGNEGMGLTKAQIYVQGVLYASGGIRSLPLPEVAGNEGFFSAIGDGLKAAWEYIKKMFKSIFGFFFKTDAKEKKAEVTQSIKDTERAIHRVESPPVTVANVDAVVHQAVVKVQRLPEGREKQKLEAKIEEIKAEPSAPKKVEETKKVVKELFDTLLFGPHSTKTEEKGIAEYVADLQARVDKYKRQENDGSLTQEERDGHWAGAIALQQVLNGMTGFPQAAGKIDNIADAKNYISKALRCVEAMDNSLQTIRNTESFLKEELHDLEALIANGGKRTAGQDHELQMKLMKAKLALGEATAVIKSVLYIFELIGVINKRIQDACLVKEE